MKKYKFLFIALALALIVSTVGAATLAYVFMQTPEVENSFVPVYVRCEVQEEFTGAEKTNVKVKNTGDIKAYVRATFVVMWVNDDGNVYGVAPKAGVDYSISFGSPSWNLGSDSFYYYALPVEPGEITEAIISSLSILTEPPDGYKLNVHVAATAIQANPPAAVESAWGATVHENGAIFAP